MEKVLISIPDALALRMRSIIPARQRSKTISTLIEQEIEKRERALYACALEVENDKLLNEEMQDWDVTVQDGVNDESW